MRNDGVIAGHYAVVGLYSQYFVILDVSNTYTTAGIDSVDDSRIQTKAYRILCPVQLIVVKFRHGDVFGIRTRRYVRNQCMDLQPGQAGVAIRNTPYRPRPNPVEM